MDPVVVRPVLSLFPGIGLLDHAFELEGFTVFRGPDILWGGDVREFHVMAGVFDGLIGGPPCQAHSAASAIRGTRKVDLIPEFVRVFHEAKPKWVVMENVRGALGHEAIPADWQPVQLRDFDCGGETARVSYFWTWPTWTLQPAARPGQAQHSVMATTWKRGSSDSQYVKDKGFLPGDLPIEEYARLQGAPEIGARLIEHGCGKRYAVHVLGNGVPVPMGRYMARAIRDGMYSHNKMISG